MRLHAGPCGVGRRPVAVSLVRSAREGEHRMPDPKEPSSSQPPKPGEPGSAENPIKVSLADAAPGGRMVKMSLFGVTLWEEGEQLTPEERDRRTSEALQRGPEDLRPAPGEGARQDYAGPPGRPKP